MRRFVLAVDGGSQSTKVCVIDEHGEVVVSVRNALRPYALGPDGITVHPGDDLWDSLLLTGRQAVEAFTAQGGDAAAIEAIGLCGIRFCRAYVDAGGELVEPILSWMDARVSRPVAHLDPRVATITSAGGYLGIRLTGERKDSAASFLGMWPLDLATRRWSSSADAFEATGMQREVLPELVDPGESVGTLLPEVAEVLGLPAGCPVIATANDKAVEALGCGVVHPGQALLSLGTYIAAMTTGDHVEPEDSRYWVNLHSVPGQYLFESEGIRRGMWTLSWLRSLVTAGCAEAPSEDEVLARLEAGARSVPPGCLGLVAVPDFLAPPDQPHRRGTFIGLTGEHDHRHLYRAVLEGIALTMARHLDSMSEALGTEFAEVIVSGGGSRSDLMMQIVADSYGVPARRPAMPDAAGLGAAICAAVGVGIHGSFADAVSSMVGPGQVFQPGAAAPAYPAVRARIDAVPALLEPVLRALV